MYIYRKIPDERSFRILVVQGDSNVDSPIDCSLIDRSLNGLGREFEAISYCWNGQRPTRTITCEGQDLRVTINCEASLRRLRPVVKGEKRLLWIDGVCIDQANDIEKSHQVAIMGSIYNRAKQVVIWLGEARDSGRSSHDRAFRWLVNLAEAAECSVAETAKKRILEIAHELNTSELNEFFNARYGVPWFKRLWVVQEVVLSREATLIYGDQAVSLPSMMKSRQLMHHISEDEEHGPEQPGAGAANASLWNAFAVHDLGARLYSSSRALGRPDDLALCDFMAEVRFSGATDQKDKILGLYNILSDVGVQLPAPDYAKPTATIFREAAAAIISSTGSLRILEQVDGPGSTEGLASWVPDWASTKHNLGLGTGLGDKSIKSVGSTSSFFEFRDEGHKLVLRGVVMDAIASKSSHAYMHVDERLGHAADYKEWTKNPPINDLSWRETIEMKSDSVSDILRLANVRALQDFVALALGPDLATASEISVLALYHTLMSQIDPMLSERDVSKARTWFQVLVNGGNAIDGDGLTRTLTVDRRYKPQLAADLPNLQKLRSSPEYCALQCISRDEALDIIHSRIDRIRYKTLFKTASGRLGLAPWPITAGDYIVWFSGMRLPMVVRKAGEHFRLIAQAYVHGAMDGVEALESGQTRQEYVLV